MGGKRLNAEQESKLKQALKDFPELTDEQIAKLIGTSPTTVGNERRGERCKGRRAREATLLKAQAALGVAPGNDNVPENVGQRCWPEGTLEIAAPKSGVQGLHDELEAEALRRL